ncbi:fibrocystin-L-like [Branchiostoma floridae x Branchiostoma japonicum]
MAVGLLAVLVVISAWSHEGVAQGTTRISGVAPHVGSLKGGTNIKIFGQNIPVDISMTFAVVRVKFLSATHQYPCDVEETSVSTGQIECYSRAMPSGVYTPQVTLCSSADDCRDIPCLGEDEQDCKFETKTHYTPYIKSVTPTSGYPD